MNCVWCADGEIPQLSDGRWVHDHKLVTWLCWRKAAEEHAEVEQLRLERDVLALNCSLRDTSIIVVSDGKDVVGVVWPENLAASDRPIEMPSYYDAAKANESKGE